MSKTITDNSLTCWLSEVVDNSLTKQTKQKSLTRESEEWDVHWAFKSTDITVKFQLPFPPRNSQPDSKNHMDMQGTKQEWPNNLEKKSKIGGLIFPNFKT